LNKDGLNWWANPDDGSGTIVIRNGLTNAVLKNFGTDFGTKIMHNFYTTFSMDVPTLFSDVNAPIQINVYPNPSDAVTNFAIDFAENSPAQIEVFDVTGKQVYSKNVSALFTAFNLELLSAGMYTVIVTQGSKVNAQKFIVR
jgi:hypothetical protein